MYIIQTWVWFLVRLYLLIQTCPQNYGSVLDRPPPLSPHQGAYPQRFFFFTVFTFLGTGDISRQFGSKPTFLASRPIEQSLSLPSSQSKQARDQADEPGSQIKPKISQSASFNAPRPIKQNLPLLKKNLNVRKVSSSLESSKIRPDFFSRINPWFNFQDGTYSFTTNL